MKYEKIIVVGCNKTATTAIHSMFIAGGIKSQHRPYRWQIERYKAISDNGDKMPWKEYDRTYPNSLFILNVRPLDTWLLSRSFHYFFKNNDLYHPPSIKLYTEWIKERNDHHFKVLRHFANTSKLRIIDISKDGWTDDLCDLLDIGPFQSHKKVGNSPPWLSNQSKEILDKVFEDLGIPEEERGNSMVIECLLDEDEKAKYKQLKEKFPEISNFEEEPRTPKGLELPNFSSDESLSICINHRGNSKVDYNDIHVDLFEKCINSIVEAMEPLDVEFEVVIANWSKKENWKPEKLSQIDHTVINIDPKETQGFSMGLGFNKAFIKSKGDNVLFLEVDTMISDRFIIKGLNCIKHEVLFFPVGFALPMIEDSNGAWKKGNYVTSMLTRSQFQEVGQWDENPNINPNNLYKKCCKSILRTKRRRVNGFFFQWRPLDNSKYNIKIGGKSYQINQPSEPVKREKGV